MRKENRYTYCPEHKHYGSEKPNILTIQDALYVKHHRAAAFSLVRWRAKTYINEQNIDMSKCQNCGYDKIVEICHRKQIASFPVNTLISTVNKKENLLFLCPNCHWEFDRGLLKI